jgi:hypothetical protein
LAALRVDIGLKVRGAHHWAVSGQLVNGPAKGRLALFSRARCSASSVAATGSPRPSLPRNCAPRTRGLPRIARAERNLRHRGKIRRIVRPGPAQAHKCDRMFPGAERSIELAGRSHVSALILYAARGTVCRAERARALIALDTAFPEGAKHRLVGAF